MAKSNSLMAGVSRFAHFAGLSRGAVIGADEDDEQQQAQAGDDDDVGAGAGATDDEDDDQSGKAGGKNGGGDDNDEEDDDEDEMKGSSASASARRREQARIAHIVTSKAAAANPVLAISLACETRMTRQEAVRVLASQPEQGAAEPQRNRHSRPDREARNTDLSSDSAPPNGRQAVNASWDKAFGKAGIKPR